jgi:hypothetical protein
LALVLKELIRERAKDNISVSGGDRKSKNAISGFQKSDKPIHTDKELAKIAGVSHNTIFRKT